MEMKSFPAKDVATRHSRRPHDHDSDDEDEEDRVSVSNQRLQQPVDYLRYRGHQTGDIENGAAPATPSKRVNPSTTHSNGETTNSSKDAATIRSMPPELQMLNMSFVFGLDDWIRQHAETGDNRLLQGGRSGGSTSNINGRKETFRDANGVLRYTDTWLEAIFEETIAADEETAARSNYRQQILEFDSTGCVTIPVLLPEIGNFGSSSVEDIRQPRGEFRDHINNRSDRSNRKSRPPLNVQSSGIYDSIDTQSAVVAATDTAVAAVQVSDDAIAAGSTNNAMMLSSSSSLASARACPPDENGTEQDSSGIQQHHQQLHRYYRQEEEEKEWREETKQNSQEQATTASVRDTQSSTFRYTSGRISDGIMTVYETKFLADWQRLWYSFANDREDEVITYARLFRMCVEFFFHHRTCQLMVFLSVYNFVIFTILDASTSYNGVSEYYKVYLFIFPILSLAFYLWFLTLFRTSVWGTILGRKELHTAVHGGGAMYRNHVDYGGFKGPPSSRAGGGGGASSFYAELRELQMQEALRHQQQQQQQQQHGQNNDIALEEGERIRGVFHSTAVTHNNGSDDETINNNNYSIDIFNNNSNSNNDIDRAGQRFGQEEGKVNVSQAYTLHWMASLKQMLRAARKEGTAFRRAPLFSVNNNHNNNKSSSGRTNSSTIYEDVHFSETTTVLTYYQLLNVAMKFHARHCRVPINKTNFDRPIYRATLFAIVFILPIYSVMYLNYVPFLEAVVNTCPDEFQNKRAECVWFYHSFLVSLGFLTTSACLYILQGSILLSLVAMAYGGELAHRMVNSWIYRFSMLRRVHRRDLKQQHNSDAPHSSSTCSSSSASSDSPDDSSCDDRYDESDSPLLVTPTGNGSSCGGVGGVRSPLAMVAAGLTGRGRKGKGKGAGRGDRERGNGICGADTNGKSSKAQRPQQQQRKRSKKGRENSSDTTIRDGNRRNNNTSDKDMGKERYLRDQSGRLSKLTPRWGSRAIGSETRPLSDLIPYISRDAYEHYLFIREYMHHAGIVWQTKLIGCLLLIVFSGTLGASVIFMYASVSDFSIFRFVVFIVMRVLLLFFLPIAIISHANASMLILKKRLNVSAPEDFSVLGGKARWDEFLQNVPAHWTFFGILLTWERLFNLLWGIGISGGLTAFIQNAAH